MKIYKGKKRHCYVYFTPAIIYQRYRCDGKKTHCIGIAIGHYELFIEIETMTEPDYRSFANKANIGNTMDEEERKRRQEWLAWRKNKKKTWYL